MQGVRSGRHPAVLVARWFLNKTATSADRSVPCRSHSDRRVDRDRRVTPQRRPTIRIRQNVLGHNEVAAASQWEGETASFATQNALRLRRNGPLRYA